jgi:hypothetical protein
MHRVARSPFVPVRCCIIIGVDGSSGRAGYAERPLVSIGAFCETRGPRAATPMSSTADNGEFVCHGPPGIEDKVVQEHQQPRAYGQKSKQEATAS